MRDQMNLLRLLGGSRACRGGPRRPKPTLTPAIVGPIVDRKRLRIAHARHASPARIDRCRCHVVGVVTMEHGDDSGLSDTAAPAAADLVGTTGAHAGFHLRLPTSACRKIGYIGSKRYVRIDGHADRPTTRQRASGGDPGREGQPDVSDADRQPAGSKRLASLITPAAGSPRRRPLSGAPTMRAFADLLETTAAATDDAANRNGSRRLHHGQNRAQNH
jgi:hypothetical protein